MWKYIHYYIYLEAMDTSDHNAIEKYVYEMVSWCNITYYYVINIVNPILYRLVKKRSNSFHYLKHGVWRLKKMKQYKNWIL